MLLKLVPITGLQMDGTGGFDCRHRCGYWMYCGRGGFITEFSTSQQGQGGEWFYGRYAGYDRGVIASKL